uniref:Zgc:162297 n=1 Tax=Salmo trutta TaxID=8032 RepID=A0A673WIF5_SALTR
MVHVQDGLIIENMHHVPYTFSIGPEVYASMTAVCAAGRGICPSLPFGGQILSAANTTYFVVVYFQGMDFIRAEEYVFSHVADEGLLNACVGAEHVQIFTDIKKKHGSHALTSDVRIVEMARAAESTGLQADPVELRDVAGSVRLPVLIGSGVTHDNVEHYLDAIAMINWLSFQEGRRLGKCC